MLTALSAKGTDLCWQVSNNRSNRLDLVFMLQKMSKHIQVLLSVFCTLDVWKPVMGYAKRMGYAI